MRFRDLPFAARVYIGAVMCGGAALTAASLMRGAFARPLLLMSFVAASIAVHTIKMIPPAGMSYSMSLGFGVSFASLLALGPAATAWTVIAGAWAQSGLNTKTPNPWYRVTFNMSAIVLSIEATAETLSSTGGRNLDGAAGIVIPSIAASALVFFLVNSVMVAIVIGMTERRSIIKTWDQEFLWTAPNFFIGALAATVAVQSVTRYGFQAVALLVAPLYLTYRLYKAYLDRVERVTRTNQELQTLYERAQTQSLTDSLTELPNRRFLASHAFNELARARREGYPVAFLMVDIDEFKSINDLCGHQQGDEALRAVATCLRSGLRPYDVCGRYGGDEFVLILSRCDTLLAEKRASELARSVAAVRNAEGLRIDRPLSISIGAVVFPVDGSTYEGLLAAADSHMYASKRRRTLSSVEPL